MSTDIDIDVGDRNRILENFDHRVAMIQRTNSQEPHRTGVYFQNIPFDPFTNVASIDHTQAAAHGYFKIDFLNNQVYQNIHSMSQLKSLISQPPDWSLLTKREVVQQLYHINQYYDLVQQMLPTSIEQLAMLLAVIRPAKRHLQGKSWSEVEKQVWTKTNTDNKYQFKRAHAIAFAHVIVIQLNQLAHEQ